MPLLLRVVRVLAAAALCVAANAQAQSVEFFSPRGEVKGVRQVTARFTKPMVPFGDPRELDPFTIDCAEREPAAGPIRATGCTTSRATCRQGCAARSR